LSLNEQENCEKTDVLFPCEGDDNIEVGGLRNNIPKDCEITRSSSISQYSQTDQPLETSRNSPAITVQVENPTVSGVDVGCQHSSMVDDGSECVAQNISENTDSDKTDSGEGEKDTSAYILTINSLQEQLLEVSAARDSLRDQLSCLQVDCDRLRDSIESLDQTAVTVNKEKISLLEREESLERELAETTAELQAAKLHTQEASFFEKAYTEVIKDKTDLEQEVSRLTYKLRTTTETSEETVRQLSESVVTLGAQMTVSSNQSVKLFDEVQALNSEVVRLGAENTDSKQRVHELETEKRIAVETVQGAAVNHKAEKERLILNQTSTIAKLAELKNLNTEFEEKNSVLTEEIRQASGEIERLKTEFAHSRKTVAEMEVQLSQAFDTMNDNEERIREIEGIVESREREIADLQEATSSVRKQRDKVSVDLKEDLDIMSSSVQRREKMWDSVRESMEREILTLRFDLNAKISNQKLKIRVS